MNSLRKMEKTEEYVDSKWFDPTQKKVIESKLTKASLSLLKSHPNICNMQPQNNYLPVS